MCVVEPGGDRGIIETPLWLSASARSPLAVVTGNSRVIVSLSKCLSADSVIMALLLQMMLVDGTSRTLAGLQKVEHHTTPFPRRWESRRMYVVTHRYFGVPTIVTIIFPPTGETPALSPFSLTFRLGHSSRLCLRYYWCSDSKSAVDCSTFLYEDEDLVEE